MIYNIDNRFNNVEEVGCYMDTIEEKKCGIIMPIAGMPGYTADHWKEVKNIIIQATEQITEYNFKTEIVSNSDGEIDVIHKRIVQNLYNADIVVCDISGRNPNVLFELGMRLTFDKPTILIKDDETQYIFDTGVIEHINYPKDLRYSQVVEFKKELAKRIQLTYEKYTNDTSYSTFLGNFGEFRVPTLNQTTVTDVNQIMLDEMTAIRNELSIYKKEIATTKSSNNTYKIIPAGLKNIITKHVTEFDDHDSPEIVIHKEEFVKLLLANNIDPMKVDRNLMMRYVQDAQGGLLPF